jgi:hypothetical protein
MKIVDRAKMLGVFITTGAAKAPGLVYHFKGI